MPSLQAYAGEHSEEPVSSGKTEASIRRRHKCIVPATLIHPPEIGFKQHSGAAHGRIDDPHDVGQRMDSKRSPPALRLPTYVLLSSVEPKLRRVLARLKQRSCQNREMVSAISTDVGFSLFEEADIQVVALETNDTVWPTNVRQTVTTHLFGTPRRQLAAMPSHATTRRSLVVHVIAMRLCIV